MAKNDGNGDKKESEFDKFSKFYAEYARAKNAASASDATGRLGARGYASSFLQSVSQDTRFAEQASDENLRRIAAGDQFSIDQALNVAQAYHSERLKAFFKPDNLEAIVSSMPRDKIVKNFSYAPVEIKDDKKHNEIAHLHGAYISFLMAEKGDEKAAKAVEQIATSYFRKGGIEGIEKKLNGDKSLSEDTRKAVVATVSGIFTRYPLPEEKLKEYAEKAKKSIYDELNGKFKNDNERASYAVRSIAAGTKELMDKGQEGYERAAQMIYQIGNMQDEGER